MEQRHKIQKDLGNDLAALVTEQLDPEPRSADDEILTTEEARKYFKTTQRELLRWTDIATFGSFALPAYAYGRGYRFRRSDIDRFIERFKVTKEMQAMLRERAAKRVKRAA